MLKRTITAAIAILVFFPIVIYGGWPFYLAMLLISTLGLFELMRMRQMALHKIPMIISFLLLWYLVLPESALAFSVPLLDFLVVIMLILLGYTVISKNQFTFDDVGFITLATIYLGLGFHYIIMSREAGLEFIFFAIIVILSTDIGAYFSGFLFGKHKLIPAISPNKTIEGSIGGTLLAIILGMIFHLIFPVHDSLVVVIIVSFLASIVGQLGDLVESAFKRHYQVKDSGELLPGHGGILDRFDSWLFVFSFLHLIQFIQ